MYNDCCSDYLAVCSNVAPEGMLRPTQSPTPSPTSRFKSGSCVLPAGELIDGKNFKCTGKGSEECWCDRSCESTGDCCQDYRGLCKVQYSEDAESL